MEGGQRAGPGEGRGRAREVLDRGEAGRKVGAMCEAQGGVRGPPTASQTHVGSGRHTGNGDACENRRLARIAKFAGAPKAPAAGLLLHLAIGDHVEAGQPLLTIHAESPGELAYARSYAEAQEDVVLIRGKNP